jgi:glucose/arabinose dehydrogenase
MGSNKAIVAIEFMILLLVTITQFDFAAFAIDNDVPMPVIMDSNLTAVPVVTGLHWPSNMAFLGDSDILVLENKGGMVHRIINGSLSPQPLIDVNVANYSDRCMCGIEVTRNSSTDDIYVFLYFTESESQVAEDKGSGSETIGNRLYRYELVNDKLVNPKLLLDLPSEPGAWHNGGLIRMGPDENIYVTVGDINATKITGPRTKTQNYVDGTEPDGRAGILRITQDGEPVGNGILGHTYPLNLYYAYGVRNSYGIDFDPITGNLWDSENGPSFGDEINLVEPGFNSGWDKAQGVWNVFTNSSGDYAQGVGVNDNVLFSFDGKGEYSTPEFTWADSLGLTSLIFLESDKLGEKYENTLFAADYNYGRIYNFDLTKNRTALDLHGNLSDKVSERNTKEYMKEVLFGDGFKPQGITDLEVGPDGYLYVLHYPAIPNKFNGTIYKIMPISDSEQTLT